MKSILISLVAASGLVFSARSADVTTKVSDVHLCCSSCVKGVQAAVGKVPGAVAAADRETRTVTLTGPDTATVQKAADALVEAGYFGVSSDPAIKVAGHTGAKGTKVQTLHVEGVHLCCGKCVSTVDEAVKSVSGVKEHTAVKGAKAFDVTGDFRDEEVFAALHKAGLSGHAAK